MRWSARRTPRGTLPLVHADIQKVLIPRERIATRVAELSRQIAADYAAADGGEIVLVPILTGSMIFVADLVRQLPLKLRIEVVIASSYPGTATRSQGAQIVGSLPGALEGKHVLIVDDILDTGRTIALIRDELTRRRPRSLRTCVLLRKLRSAPPAVACEYIGFDIPDEFVVGYGLDHGNYYRNLPDIATLKEQVLGIGGEGSGLRLG